MATKCFAKQNQKTDGAFFLKAFNFVQRKFPMDLLRQKQWVPFYLGNGDLGMFPDPLGTNTLSFAFEYTPEGYGNFLRPILSANDAFLLNMPPPQGEGGDRDVWSGEKKTQLNWKREDVRGLKVQVDAGPVFERNDCLDEEISDYHQEVDLWDGACLTQYIYKGGLEITVDTWLSWADTRLGVIRYCLKNNGETSREINLHDKLVCKYYGTDVVFQKMQECRYAEVSTQACRIGLSHACAENMEKEHPSEEKIVLGKGEQTERIFYFSLASDAVKGVLPGDAVRHVAEARKRGYEVNYREHIEAVHDFWKKWRVELPDENIAGLYYKSMWIIAGSVGNYYPPSPTSIANPNYFGMSYADYVPPYHALIQSGHFERVSRTEEFLRAALPDDDGRGFLLPVSWGRRISAADAAQLGYAAIQQGGLWMAWMFYTRWRLSGDETFLTEKAYPIMRAASIYIASTIDRTAEGYEYLGGMAGKVPRLYSIDENGLIATNDPADIMTSAKWALQTTAEVADMLGKDSECAVKWREIAANVVIPQTDKHYVGFKGDDLEKREKMTTPSMLCGIYPIPLLVDEKIERTYLYIKNELMRRIQPAASVYSRMPLMQAWSKMMWQQVASLRLSQEMDDLIYDSLWNWKRGLSGDGCLCEYAEPRADGMRQKFYYLEVHAAVAGAVNEIMLQSHNGIIKVFPCVPTRWKNKRLVFSGLLAEVGFKVSSIYENGEVPWIEVQSLAGSDCRLELPLSWRAVLIKDEDDREIQYTLKEDKVRIDGKEQEASIAEFKTLGGGKYVLTCAGSV